MNETAQTKDLLKMRRPTKIPSLLHSGTSRCSRVVLPLFPLCRRGQRRRCYYIDFAFPGVAVRCSCRGDRKGVFYIALVLAIPAIAGRWINHFRPDLVPPPVFLVAGLVLVAFVVANLLRFVLRAPSVNTEVLCASISAYLMLGLLWTVAYWLVAQVTPEDAFAFNTNSGTNNR